MDSENSGNPASVCECFFFMFFWHCTQSKDFFLSGYVFEWTWGDLGCNWAKRVCQGYAGVVH